MRGLLLLSAFLFMLNVSSGVAAGQSSATTALTASPGMITVGSSVGLSAIVQPIAAPGAGITAPRPTGSITFIDGTTPLHTATLAPKTYSSATFAQTFGTPDPTLIGQTDQPRSGELTGDMNGDGVPDLFIYEYLSQFSGQAFLSDGKGGYQAGTVQTQTFATSASTAEYPFVTNQPQLVDVNGDGKLDLLNGLRVAYGNGDGTFASAVAVSFLSSGFLTSYAVDLNGDGKADLLAVNTILVNPNFNPFQITVTPFLNQGGGTFVAAASFPVVSSYGGGETVNFLPPAFVDLNGDGKPDLITQTQLAGPTQITTDPVVQVFLNNGDGTFGAALPVTAPDPPNNSGTGDAYGLGSGDLNGDGHLDVILTIGDDSGDLDAIILLGQGDGTFQSPLYLALATKSSLITPQAPDVVVQDFNLDGNLDLIYGNGQLALGNGDGTFTLSSPLFPSLSLGSTTFYTSLPLVQFPTPGNPAPSVVFYPQVQVQPQVSVFTPQTSSSAMLSTTTLAAGVHTITARYSGDANYAANTSSAIAVTVNQAASATAATSSVNPSFAGQSVTLTANVTSPGPTPTGNLTFTTGSVTLGVVALSGGSAAYTTTSLTTDGPQTITVAYSGDANTQASSTSISQVVNAAFALAPDGGGNTTLSVTGGQTVSAPINVTGATGFSGSVTLACSGLPTNASCSFSPASINVSGTAAVPTLLTINTARNATVSQLGPGLGAFGVACAGLILFLPRRRSATRLLALRLFAMGFATLGLSGCSNGSGPVPAPQVAAGTYPFMVTASSGNLQAQSTYTLVVQ